MRSEYYQRMLAEGKRFEQFVAAELKRLGTDIGLYETRDEQYRIGESRRGFEIKRDGRMRETGRVYIETAERTQAGTWIASGIYRTDNTIWYCIGDEQELIIFRKTALIEWDTPRRPRVGNPTSGGFLLWWDLARALAALVLVVDEHGHYRKWTDDDRIAHMVKADEIRW